MHDNTTYNSAPQLLQQLLINSHPVPYPHFATLTLLHCKMDTSSLTILVLPALLRGDEGVFQYNNTGSCLTNTVREHCGKLRDLTAGSEYRYTPVLTHFGTLH